jgi:hypothetical protein
MNKLESMVYQWVKQNPKVKNLVRDVYQALFRVVPVPGEKSLYPVISREGFFFGFHDKCPWSPNDRFLLAHGYHDIPNRLPRKGDRPDIGYFYGDDYSEFRRITSTTCFNWQQGSMLQWLGNSNRFIFNDAEGEKIISRIFTPDGDKLGDIPHPIAATDSSGTKALGYNFSRLQRYFPGYGYVYGTDPEIEKETPSSHGISRIDLESGKISLLFSIQDIASYRPEKSMLGAFHFLTHCLFSPDGQRFLFLHRWVRNGNFTFTRMFSCDLGGKDLYLFPTNEMVSHIAWQDDQHVLAYCRSVEKKDGYILFRDREEDYHVIGGDKFNSDGHPSFPSNNPGWFITDTYPDRFRRSLLILFNLLKEQRTDLGAFRQPLSYKEEIRCDLHPRWNRKGTMICFDSAHKGKRALCTMDIGDLLTSGKIGSES